MVETMFYLRDTSTLVPCFDMKDLKKEETDRYLPLFVAHLVLQFHQIGVELLGVSHPMSDIEIISLAHTLLKQWSISTKVSYSTFYI
jgi:hypothetical protein